MLTIRTDRLLLRPFRPEDAAALAEYRSDPEVARYQSWSTPFPVAAAERLIAEMQGRTRARPGEWNQIAIEHAESRNLVGDCALRILAEDWRQASIGFTLARGHWGQGFATEAVGALLGAMFAGGSIGNEGLHRVTAVCDVQNAASHRVLERVGMRREAHFV